LAQRSEASRQAIQKFVATIPAGSFRVFDVNLRPPHVADEVILESLSLANVLKLSDEELPVLASLCEVSGSDVDIMRQLADRYDLSCVALTRGAEGACLLRGDAISEASAAATHIVDTVGAGDAFAAALAVGLLGDYQLDTINRTAGNVSAFVCSQPGATPRIPSELVYT